MSHGKSPLRPIHETRSATDRSLEAERQGADAALKEQVAGPRGSTDAKVEKAREIADGTIQDAKERAKEIVDETARTKSGKRRAVSVPDEKVEQVVEKTKDVVEQVVDESKRAVEQERRTADAAKGHEREDTKRAFFDVLARERRETDQSLGQERGTADSMLRGRDEVLAVVSHDLRNLLTAIKLKAGVLERDLPDDGSRPRKLASEIRTACAVMERWANDLLDLANLDAGAGLRIAPGEHEPAEIVEEAVKMLLAPASSKKLEVRVDNAPNLPKVRCDRERILQVMANLLGNAVKFTQEGSVVVRVERASDDMARFLVRDSGPGIRRDLQARIFERGFHDETRRGGGAGLGLYISKQVIEKHGGRIWVECEEGRGSTFIFTLPFAHRQG